MKKIDTYNNFKLNENKLKDVIIMPGRFMPCHSGHIELLKQASKFYKLPIVIVQIISKNKKSPFSSSLLTKMRNAIIKEFNFIEDFVEYPQSNPAFIANIIRYLKQIGYNPVGMTCGSDREKGYRDSIKWMETSPKMKTEFPDITFETPFKLDFIIKRDDKNIVSGTLVRESLINNDFESYKKYMPKSTWLLFNEFKSELQKNESNNTFLYFNDFLFEEMKTQEVDPSQFENPGKIGDLRFWTKGKEDGSRTDDIVKTKKITTKVKYLKPSQRAIYLGKGLDLAIRNVVGSDLGTIISKDNYILDGHHKYLASCLTDLNMNVIVTQFDLNIGDLVPVLRQAGDVIGNTRGVKPESGDINIFDANINDIENCIYRGINMDKSKYIEEDAINWYESNKENIIKGLTFIQNQKIPIGAPPREEMPKIKKDQIDKVEKSINKGDIDVKTPYA